MGDNFNDISSHATNCSHVTVKPGWVNNELQTLANENVELSDGKLPIIAKKENNTSARLITEEKRTFTNGIVEI